jgi:signal transduction histidine kinase
MKKIAMNDLKQLVNETTLKLRSSKDKVEGNTIAENLIKAVMGTEFASLWIFDKDTATLVRERNDQSTNAISMLGQHGVLAKCFFTLSSGIYNYLASEKEYLPEVDNPDNIRIKSKIIVPIIDGDHFLGLVTAYSSILNIKNFTQDDLDILEALVPFLMNVIYTMHPEMRNEELEEVYTSDRLMEESKNMVEKVVEIQQEQKHTESTDATMNFLANTVHDIRTPANSLYGFLELLEDQLEDERLLSYIHNAKESAHFINDLTTSILDRVSSQRERGKAKPVQFNPSKFFADIAETFSANMYNKGIIFNIYLDPLLPKEITVEDVILKRVLMNLLNNAYKFTPAKHSVTLSVEYDKEGQRLKIAVSDTGIGIAKEKQEEIFKAFTQAEEDTKLNYGGTGLGLAISAEYVHELGGKLKLKSELDKGSSFYFTLPLEISKPEHMFSPVSDDTLRIAVFMSKENLESSKNLVRYFLKMGVDKKQIHAVKSIENLSPNTTHIVCYQEQLSDKIVTWSKQQKIPLLVIEEEFLSLLGSEEESYTVISQYGYYADTLHKFIADSKPMRILVADDDKINIELIKAILRDEFCKIDIAMNGEEALDMMKNAVKERYPYNLVYLDKHMPILSGTEVITTFRKYEKKKNTKKVFAVSISGDENTKDKSGDIFDTYVGKPFNKNAIKETISLAKSTS